MARRRGIFAVLAALLAAGVPARAATPTEVKPAQPQVPAKTFNLRDFNPAADGHTSDSAAFARALAAVEKAGGGMLVVPAGQYLTGPLELGSNLNLRLEAGAHLRFSQKREDYPRVGGRLHPLVSAKDAHDIMISGAGVIDGQGQTWWDEMHRELDAARARKQPPKNVQRPWMVVLENCQRVRLEGVTLMNSPMFQCAPIGCEDVTIDGISVLAPNTADNHAYNSDGIDPISSRRVLIARCFIDTGDDCIALKAAPNTGPVEDVLIEDCQFRNGHGCSIGSGTAPGVRNVTVRRCTWETTNLGIQIKTARDRGGVIENLYCTDLVMKRVPIPIGLACYYPGNLAPKPGQAIEPAPVTEKTPTCRDILIRNVRAELADDAGRILGLPEKPIENVTLENVTIQAEKGLRLAYVKNVTLKDVVITVPTGEAVRKEQGVAIGDGR